MMTPNAVKLRWVALAGLLLIGSVLSIHYVRLRSKTRAAVPIAQAAAPTPTPRQMMHHLNVKYHIRTADKSMYPNGDLVAKVNGKTHVVMSDVGLQILEIGDFDGNGTTDALISSYGGGSCCPTDYSLVSAMEDGRFVVIRDFAFSWGQHVTTENWHGRWSVFIVSEADGEMGGDVGRRFILENGKAVAVEEHRNQTLKAVVDMTTDMFDSVDIDDTHKLEFDLDGDGKPDVITGNLFNAEPPRSINWSVSFADGKSFDADLACGRVGVLETTTNGVHDLVCNEDRVFKWDGHTYIRPK